MEASEACCVAIFSQEGGKTCSSCSKQCGCSRAHHSSLNTRTCHSLLLSARMGGLESYRSQAFPGSRDNAFIKLFGDEKKHYKYNTLSLYFFYCLWTDTGWYCFCSISACSNMTKSCILVPLSDKTGNRGTWKQSPFISSLFNFRYLAGRFVK